jgi:hypothetical protein
MRATQSGAHDSAPRTPHQQQYGSNDIMNIEGPVYRPSLLVDEWGILFYSEPQQLRNVQQYLRVLYRFVTHAYHQVFVDC